MGYEEARFAHCRLPAASRLRRWCGPANSDVPADGDPSGGTNRHYPGMRQPDGWQATANRHRARADANRTGNRGDHSYHNDNSVGDGDANCGNDRDLNRYTNPATARSHPQIDLASATDRAANPARTRGGLSIIHPFTYPERSITMQFTATTQPVTIVTDFAPLTDLVTAVAGWTGDPGPLGPAATALVGTYNAKIAEPVAFTLGSITGTTDAHLCLLADIASDLEALEAAFVDAQKGGLTTSPFYAETEELLEKSPDLLAVTTVTGTIASQGAA